ncbi:MAG: lysylphosphatidylglycerol synthase transmembrane domain-containing protein [Acidobacteriota bacterium]
MKGKLKLLIGFLLAVVLLYFFLRSTNWRDVTTNMGAANPWLLALVVLLQPLLFLLRAVRWQCFLAPIKRIPIPPLMSSMMIGFMISFLFPGRLGEIVRPVLLGIREKISKTSAFATVVLERIVDTLAILVLLQVYYLFEAYVPRRGSEAMLSAVHRVGLIALAITAAAVVAIVLLKLRSDLAMRLFGRLASVLPDRLYRRVMHFLKSFVAGLNVYHDFRTFFLIGFYSLALWTGICTSIWICIRAFGIDLPFLLTFPVQAILVLGVAIPTPGMVGGFHAGMKIGLVQLWGVDPNLAVSTTIVLHALLVLPPIVHGLYYASREGFSISQVRELGQRESDLEEEPTNAP